MHVHCKNTGGTLQARQHEDHEPDGANPENGDVCAYLYPGFFDGMHGDRKRFHQRPFFKGDIFGQFEDALLIGDEIRCKGPLPLAVIIADIAAKVINALAAEFAMPAGNHRLEHHPVSDLQAIHSFSDTRNFTRELVAQGRRQRREGVFAFEGVHVTATDGYRPCFNQNLAGG